ncbi:DUF6441 family protein [Paracoccus mangrovi]|uniref:DUF6441 family protein n=1 Tax=Paracoccus mangrovi TaxID=1715645 RepID=A0ABV7R8E4_9RHOB
MRLKLDIDPDLVAMMEAEIKAGEKAVTGSMREAGVGLKTAWRGQITGAGLGRRLANSIRNAIYPKAGESLNATALVWSKVPVIIGAHNAGPLIRSKDGFWLAIPAEAAGKSLRGGRITPGEWERRTGLGLRFVYRCRGPSLSHGTQQNHRVSVNGPLLPFEMIECRIAAFTEAAICGLCWNSALSVLPAGRTWGRRYSS